MKSMFTIREGGAAHWAIRLVTAALVALAILWIPTRGSNGLITEATESLTLIAAAMALNLVLGYTGQISIGHSAFFGIGAYVTGICVSRWGFSPWVTFPLAFAFFILEVGLIATLQAFIFSILTAIYLGGATAESH